MEIESIEITETKFVFRVNREELKLIRDSLAAYWDYDHIPADMRLREKFCGMWRKVRNMYDFYYGKEGEKLEEKTRGMVFPEDDDKLMVEVMKKAAKEKKMEKGG